MNRRRMKALARKVDAELARLVKEEGMPERGITGAPLTRENLEAVAEAAKRYDWDTRERELGLRE